jgi:hypothetical protein
MDLIQDNGSNRMEQGSTAAGTQEKIQTFRGRDENFRGVPEHSPSFRLRRIPAPCLYTDEGEGVARRLKSGCQTLQGFQEIPPDVVV